MELVDIHRHMIVILEEMIADPPMVREIRASADDAIPDLDATALSFLEDRGLIRDLGERRYEVREAAWKALEELREATPPAPEPEPEPTEEGEDEGEAEPPAGDEDAA